MKRQHQMLLIGSTLAFSWLAMQAVHELGHALGATMTGGRVVKVILHPSRISYTRFDANPHPLFVVWMGPIVGVVLPMIALVAARWASLRAWYLFQFFAGFCLVANGAYLAFGSIGEVGDAGDLLRYGAPVLLLWLIGIVTIPVGLWLWNGLGLHFGLGQNGRVDPLAAYTMLGLVLIIAALEVLFA